MHRHSFTYTLWYSLTYTLCIALHIHCGTNPGAFWGANWSHRTTVYTAYYQSKWHDLLQSKCVLAGANGRAVATLSNRSSTKTQFFINCCIVAVDLCDRLTNQLQGQSASRKHGYQRNRAGALATKPDYIRSTCAVVLVAHHQSL